MPGPTRRVVRRRKNAIKTKMDVCGVDESEVFFHAPVSCDTRRQPESPASSPREPEPGGNGVVRSFVRYSVDYTSPMRNSTRGGASGSGAAARYNLSTSNNALKLSESNHKDTVTMMTSFKSIGSPANGVACEALRRYMTMSTSESTDIVAGSLGPVDRQSGTICRSVRLQAEEECVSARDEMSDPVEAPPATGEPGLELFGPLDQRRNYNVESPLIPPNLTIQCTDVFPQHHHCRDGQGDGGVRYNILSHSSHKDDNENDSAHPADRFHEEPHTSRSGGDDIVLCSTGGNISSRYGAVAAAVPPVAVASSTPQLLDTTTTTSQLMFKAKQQHQQHRSHRSRGAGSQSSNSSPLESADATSPAEADHGPELVSSDQVLLPAHMVRHRNAEKGHRINSGRAGSELSMDNHTLCRVASPSVDGFDLVRAPVTGIRAKLLGSEYIDEEEAAEDPEAREQQTAQLKSFYTKVVRQHLDGGEVLASPMEKSSLTKAVERPLSQIDGSTHPKLSAVEVSLPLSASGEAKKSKRKKKVAFHIDPPGPQSSQTATVVRKYLPSTLRKAEVLQKRPPSPFKLQGTRPPDETSGLDDSAVVTWQSPPPSQPLSTTQHSGAAPMGFSPLVNSLSVATKGETVTSSSAPPRRLTVGRGRVVTRQNRKAQVALISSAYESIVVQRPTPTASPVIVSLQSAVLTSTEVVKPKPISQSSSPVRSPPPTPEFKTEKLTVKKHLRPKVEGRESSTTPKTTDGAAGQQPPLQGQVFTGPSLTQYSARLFLPEATRTSASSSRRCSLSTTTPFVVPRDLPPLQQQQSSLPCATKGSSTGDAPAPPSSASRGGSSSRDALKGDTAPPGVIGDTPALESSSVAYDGIHSSSNLSKALVSTESRSDPPPSCLPRLRLTPHSRRSSISTQHGSDSAISTTTPSPSATG